MFADGMKRRRELLGLTQKELSKRSGVPQSTISAVECGARIPKEDTMAMIASGLNCSVGYLLSDEKNAAGDPGSVDDEIVTLVASLSLHDRQRILDFAAGLSAARKAPPSH